LKTKIFSSALKNALAYYNAGVVNSGAISTIASYKASVARVYNETSGLVHFEKYFLML
jgi:predicted transglutaminase-like protease